MNLASLDLNLLVVFDALLVEGSVTAAAKRVALSQPAVSNALARLRTVLGDPLFVRSGRGLVATPRARELAAPIRRALDELASALEPSEFDPKRAQRTFQLVMPDIAELVLMPALTERIRREAPGVNLRVVQGPATRADEVLAGAAPPDLVLAMLDDRTRTLERTPLLALEFVCLVRRDHPRVGKKLSLERFLELEHVLVAPGGTARGVIDEMLAARGIERRVALTLAHFFSAAMVVSVTDLVMSATSIFARTAERILPVRAVPHPLGAPTVMIGQLWHPSRTHDAAHRWLRDLFAEVARTQMAASPAKRRR